MAGSNITSTLKISLIDDVSGPAKTVSAALKQAEVQAKEIGKAIEAAGVSSKLGDQLRRLGASAGTIRQVGEAWQSYTKSAQLAARASDWTKTQASSVRAWERQTVAALRNITREEQAFARAQQRAREMAFLPGLPGGGKGGGGGMTAGKVLENAGSVAMGMGLPAVGAALVTGMTAAAAVNAGADLSHELARMHASGMSSKEIDEAKRASLDLSTKFPSISQTEALHMLRNARSIVGSYTEAAEIMEPLAKLRVVAQAQHPGEDVSEDFDKLLKGLEIKGVTQKPEQFRKYMEGIAKGLNVFGDTLKPYQYYEMFKYGRQATPGLSEKFILGTAPTLAQELGGSSYGNAVSGFNSALVGGVMKHTAALEFAKLGLIGKKDIERTKTGSIKGLKPGGNVVGWKLAQADPNEWVKQYLIPAFKKARITEPSEQMREVGRLFQNKVAAQLVSILTTQQSRIEKDTALLEGAPGLAAADTALKTDPKLGWEELKNSLENLGAAATGGAMESIASGLNTLAGGINSLAASEITNKSTLDWILRKGTEAGDWLSANTSRLVQNSLPPGKSPYGALYGPVTPEVDASGATNAAKAADQAKMSFEQLGSVSVAPNVDTAAIDAAIGKVRELNAELARTGGLVRGAAGAIAHDTTAAHQLKAALGSVQRGRFSTGGVQGD